MTRHSPHVAGEDLLWFLYLLLELCEQYISNKHLSSCDCVHVNASVSMHVVLFLKLREQYISNNQIKISRLCALYVYVHVRVCVFAFVYVHVCVCVFVHVSSSRAL
jgi:hypothetical protein